MKKLTEVEKTTGMNLKYLIAEIERSIKDYKKNPNDKNGFQLLHELQQVGEKAIYLRLKAFYDRKVE